jgi:hypothetical protein
VKYGTEQPYTNGVPIQGLREVCIVIRIAGDGAGTRIDMRSTSRQGHSDYGMNAPRIRAFMGALRRRIG